MVMPHMHANIHTDTHTHANAHTHSHSHARVHAHMWYESTHAQTCAHADVCMYTHMLEGDS